MTNYTLRALIFVAAILGQLVSCSSTTANKHQESSHEDNSEGFISSNGPLIGSFMSTMVAEFGDTTFIITAILASKYGRGWVFLGCFGSLVVMSLVSCFIGNASEHILSRSNVKILSSIMFLVYGCKAIYHVVTDTVEDDDEEIAERLEKIFKDPKSKKSDDDDVKSEQQGKPNPKRKVALRDMSGPAVALQTFTQTFLGEWGDSSQISTVALSASFSFWEVLIGSAAAQILCCVLALIGGKILAKQFSEKTMTLLGGIFFLANAFATIVSAI